MHELDRPPISKLLAPESGLIYLSAPYGHDDKRVISARLAATDLIAAQLIAAGSYIFSPLSHNAHLSQMGYEPPVGWYEFGLRFLDACQTLAVLQLPGWKQSHGVQLEIHRATQLELPLCHLQAEDFELPAELWHQLRSYD